METKPAEISSSKMFGGYNKRYKHFSPTLGCSMTFHIYFPPSPSSSHKFPVLYWLSGLTCTDENFITKSGAQRAASREGVALIVPDTSPNASFNYKSRTYTHEVFILLNAIRATCNL
ncbi:S-formylglutathione hydrolase [Fagus crenata]